MYTFDCITGYYCIVFIRLLLCAATRGRTRRKAQGSPRKERVSSIFPLYCNNETTYNRTVTKKEIGLFELVYEYASSFALLPICIAVHVYRCLTRKKTHSHGICKNTESEIVQIL